MKTSTANLLLLLAGTIWGFGFLAQKNAMDDLSPLLFVGLRFLLAAAVIFPLAILENRRTQPEHRLNGQWLARFVVLGVIFFAGMALQQIGLVTASITKSGFLTTLYVVIVPIIAWAVFRDRIPGGLWPLAGICLFGVYLLSPAGFSSLSRGELLVVAGAFVFAVHVIVIGRFATASKLPYQMAAIQFLTCGILGCVAHFIWMQFDNLQTWPTTDALSNALPEVLYAGVFSGAIAFTLQAVAQSHTAASVAAILMSSESLVSALLGAWFLNERLNGYGYLGCLLIFASIIATELYSIRRDRQAEAPTPTS